MRYLNFFLLCLTVIGKLTAQRPGGGGAPIARVYGKVLEGTTSEAIPFASVVVKPMRKDTIVGGELTKTNGFFDIKGLTPGMYVVKITALGFADTSFQVKLVPPTVELDAGNIRLSTSTKTLNEVTVTGTKSSVELAVDRRIYNIDKNIVATGGTAIDALKTIPAVSIDADGNVELRNSAPMVFIDGKPSPLTLAQIPASEIERIEIITNPSARYEAAAAGGIINVVLKKNKMPGIFGIVNGGVGTNERANAMASINIRQSSIGISASYNFNTSKNPAYSYNIIEQHSSFFKTDGINQNNRQMQFLRLGLDYDFNARNTISISGNANFMGLGFFDDQKTIHKLPTPVLSYSGTRVAGVERDVTTYTGQMDYKRTFPTPGREWISFVQFSHSNNEGVNQIEQRFVFDDGSSFPINPDKIKSDGYMRGPTFQAQTDYVHPIDNNRKVELGARFQRKETSTRTDAFRLDATGAFAPYALLSVNYAYKELISAAYGNLMGRRGKLGYQAGLRLENSIFDGFVPGGDSTFSYRFPNDLSTLHYLFFPSFFGTYTIKEGQDLQFNISRKLERPNFLQVMPFMMQQDNQSFRTGNPNLLPEFKYVAEVNQALTRGWGSYFISMYGRYEDQPITTIVLRADDANQSIINTFINGRYSIRFGLEQNVKYKIAKNLDANVGLNIFRNQVNATLNGQDLKRSGFNWDTRANIEYRFAKNWVFQTNGEYDAPRIVPQGRTLRNYGFDIALKRNFNPIGSITLQLVDVLNSKGRGTILTTPTYVQENWRRREVRYFQLSAQLRFGKPDASIFKQRRQMQQRPSGGGDMDF